MLLDYTLSGALPNQERAIWSQAPLHPLAPGPLTPFSFSVLAEIVGRAWFQRYDRVGFGPTPRARLIRRHHGHAYLNLSLSARLEAEQAGIEPPVLQVNGKPLALAAWTKPGFLAGFKTGRAQKKLDEQTAEMAKRMAATTQAAQRWYLRTQEMRWSQAEVLQVMEEIERAGMEAMMAYLAARQTLEGAYARLLRGLTPHAAQAGPPLQLINNTLCDQTGLVEAEIALAVSEVSAAVSDPKATTAWIRAGAFANWQADLGKAAGAVQGFLQRYGHRALGEAEMARTRWDEDPTPLFRALLTCLEHPPKRPAKLPAVNHVQKLLDHLPPELRKQGPALVQQIHELHRLQSHALHALAYIWGGTRRWALAAAREAMGDGRLEATDEIFFFELEEIKQMMTGEWNISARDEIRTTLATRRTAHAADQAAHPAPLLIDDQEAQPAHPGLPGAAGQITGPLRRWAAGKKNDCSGAILGAEVLDSGWALTLPVAGGYVAAAGSPLDPFVVAARAWHHPTVVGVGSAYRGLLDGAQTTVDGDAGTVQQ